MIVELFNHQTERLEELSMEDFIVNFNKDRFHGPVYSIVCIRKEDGTTITTETKKEK